MRQTLYITQIKPMENKIDYPKKVNYSNYEHSFNDHLLKDFENIWQLRDFDMEKMRGLVYGYTFTEDYAKGIIPDALSMDYWRQINNHKFNCSNKNIVERCTDLGLVEYLGQEGLLCEAIRSTGDGTMDNPYCVICVGQEYEFLRYGGFGPINITRQRLLPGWIDCIDIEGMGYSKSVYFDMSRWFEKVKLF